MRAAIEGGYEENEERENEKGSEARTEREELRGTLCAAEVQVADSPLFEHAVNLLPPFSPVLVFVRSFFLALSLGPLPRIQARSCAYAPKRMSASACLCAMHAPRGLRAIYACACDDVGARGEIYKRRAHTHLSIVGEILLCPRSASRATDEYRQVLAFSLFLSCLMESSRFVFR